MATKFTLDIELDHPICNCQPTDFEFALNYNKTKWVLQITCNKCGTKFSPPPGNLPTKLTILNPVIE